MSTSKMIPLKCSDDEIFLIEESVALESKTIKRLIAEGYDSAGIHLPTVTGPILTKVVEYCTKHLSMKEMKEDSDEVLKSFDTEFVKVDQKTLFELVMAANFLEINSLLDLTCQAVADMIKDKSVEEVREIFDLKNDLTPREEAEIRTEFAWAFV